MNTRIRIALASLVGSLLATSPAQALPAWLTPGHEYHVAVTGSEGNPGSRSKPLKTISAAAQKAMPGGVRVGRPMGWEVGLG